jgi:hypothetical protein
MQGFPYGTHVFFLKNDGKAKARNSPKNALVHCHRPA